MALPDYLLDTSWSTLYISSGNSSPILYNLFRPTANSSSISEQLRELSGQCHDYILSRAPAYKDELNDETEKTGILRECVIDYVKVYESDRILGLSIEMRYQKVTYRVILVPCSRLDPARCPVSVVLYKASQSHIKDIKSWLDEKFGVSGISSLVFPPWFIPRTCSEFMMGIDAAWSDERDADALREVTLRQVVGSLRITITISNATGAEIAPQLKSMDFDVPVETVGMLLKKAKEKGGGNGYQFLEELAGALHEKTGLRLPFTGKVTGVGGNVSNNESATNGSSEPEVEPPLKVTRIHCAAFALRADGGFKLAGKPIEDAEAIGYDGLAVRTSYMRVLQSIFDEAERRRQQEEP